MSFDAVDAMLQMPDGARFSMLEADPMKLTYY